MPPVANEQVNFARDIQPLLAARCHRCHGPNKAEGGLRLDRQADVLTGGNSGPALQPRKSSSSRLIHYVAGLNPDVVMPPSGARLTREQIGLLRAWIDQGAPWPENATADAGRPSGSDHWAFQPIARSTVPNVTNKAWVRNAIDCFILARLEKERISPSPEADRVMLIRRLTLDLLGLPPSLAEVDAFVADARPAAYERLVERLLASPHYGERWGRHWLDAARYADSDGYNGDAARPIWKYRDWVIDALNKDLPFDQFAMEQMAGDLLPAATLEQKIATGFHRNTLFNAEGGNDLEEFRVERVVDRVSTTGAVFLGLTLGCAECHAHKYDPIAQREFYELYAFLNNADELKLEMPTAEDLAKRRQYHARLAQLDAQLAAHDRGEVAGPKAWERRLTFLPTNCTVLAPAPFLMILADVTRQSDPVRVALLQQIDQLKKKAPLVTATLVLGEATQPRTTRIHLRGDFRRPGDTVRPNVPRVLSPLPSVLTPRPSGERGRGEGDRVPSRLELAQWLVSPANPLTARVTVNRIWQSYFGVGLVETENDFGKQGSPPTHPELLDWLASTLCDQGWSLKALHRLIVCSATYRQTSHLRPDLAAVDPRNQLLARQVRLRLEAEVVRDILLASSGLLSLKIGGPSTFPYQPAGIMELRRSVTPWLQSPGADRYRRGLYTHFWRTSPHPFLVAFDAPKTDTACTRRHRSNTPLQALMLLNDQAFVDCARSLAARILREAPPSDPQRTHHAFRLCLAREPDPTEQGYLNNLLAQQREEFTADPKAARQLAGRDAAESQVTQLAAWTAVARVLLNLDELITRE